MNIYRFSDDYILKALRGDYTTKIPSPATFIEKILVKLLAATMFVVSSIIGLLGLIPILGALLEVVINNYPRGALGFYLRGSLYAPQFGAIGKNALIDMGVSFWNPKNIFIGSNCHIDTNVKIEASGRVSIGDYVHVASNVVMQGAGTITVGDYCAIAASSHIYSASNYYRDPDNPKLYTSMSAMAPADKQSVKVGAIVLEPYSFVSISATLLPGVTLGHGAVVGANSVVTKSVEAEQIVGGVPAKVIAERPNRLEQK